MSDVIDLAQRRRFRSERRTLAVSTAIFAFDLAHPGTYLAMERVERSFSVVRLLPVSSADPTVASESVRRRQVEVRARELRLPVVWPDHSGLPVPAAMRVCHLAVERGMGAPFVLAATRLAYAGGYDLRDPAVLAEAATAAALSVEEALEAAADPRRGVDLRVSGRARAREELPALRVGDRWFGGERRVEEAALAARDRAAGVHAGVL